MKDKERYPIFHEPLLKGDTIWRPGKSDLKCCLITRLYCDSTAVAPAKKLRHQTIDCIYGAIFSTKQGGSWSRIQLIAHFYYQHMQLYVAEDKSLHSQPCQFFYHQLPQSWNYKKPVPADIYAASIKWVPDYSQSRLAPHAVIFMH